MFMVELIVILLFRPNYAGQPLIVSLSIYVKNIPSININKHTGELTLEMFYRHHWTDQRLQFDKVSFGMVLPLFYCDLM